MCGNSPASKIHVPTLSGNFWHQGPTSRAGRTITRAEIQGMALFVYWQSGCFRSLSLSTKIPDYKQPQTKIFALRPPRLVLAYGRNEGYMTQVCRNLKVLGLHRSSNIPSFDFWSEAPERRSSNCTSLAILHFLQKKPES